MESLAPPHKCLVDIKFKLQRGDSLRQALESYCSESRDDFVPVLYKWFLLLQKGCDVSQIQVSNPYRQYLLDIFNEGMAGKPILSMLCSFEQEIEQACSAELEEKLKKLPILSLIPLFLLQLPAVLLLLFVPMLQNFSEVF